MTPTAYPLQWPPDFPRGKSTEKGRFQSTLPKALKNVQHSLKLFAEDSGKTVTEIVISSYYTLGVHKPADPGVAVWFKWDGMGLCIAVDRYNAIEANLQAIHHIIEARRVELRHGTLSLVRATFQGFKALPSSKRDWWHVLNVPRLAPLPIATEAFRELARVNHPDVAGDTPAANARMAEINQAYEEAKLSFQNPQ